MSDSGNGYDLNSSNASRHEKSLGLLTTRFVSLLQDAKDGILDLKQVMFCCFFLFAYVCVEWCCLDLFGSVNDLNCIRRFG
jgi:hypothetical protein